MDPQSNSFWQANFWGIIGTISGLSGVLISWATHKYNTPKIEIDEINLIISDEFIPSLKNQTVVQLKNSFLEFKLDIIVRNSQGGPGSIDKPNLLIKIPFGKRFFIFPLYHTIISYPHTEHTEYERENENTTKFWTVRHGRTFNLGGGEKADDQLEYQIDDPEMIYQIVQHFSSIQYLIEYKDNKGKKYVQKIQRLTNESTLR